VKQSDLRAPGRRPASFGRAEVEGEPAEDMTIRGGESLHLVLHLDVTPSQESLEALHAAIAETTRRGVVDGYAAAVADMDAEVTADGAPPAGAEQLPGG
jgi:hypothetical protein